uniref:Uncharacterized protein n=1 Tax=viral metagenome TaxID=1070528 RepID=A0A6M3KLH5_9ZZZZ
MHTYRVWFTNDTAVMIDALDEYDAERIITQGLKDGTYYGKVKSFEQLN